MCCLAFENQKHWVGTGILLLLVDQKHWVGIGIYIITASVLDGMCYVTGYVHWPQRLEPSSFAEPEGYCLYWAHGAGVAANAMPCARRGRGRQRVPRVTGNECHVAVEAIDETI